MDFNEFLPSNKEENEKEVNQEKISNNQIYDIITSRKPDWQQIIYDLINSEQMDPLNIDIVLLTNRYFEKIEELEKADFYISSKVLLAASLLLRIKSEFLLNKYMKSIDDMLFGRKDEKNYVIEKIQIDSEELPILIPKTPLPRLRRVTLTELMNALNKAINTESRRIKREVAITRAKKLSEVDFPEFRRIDLKDRIKQFYAKVLTFLKKKAVSEEKDLNKVAYSTLVGKEREEKLASFLPLLHLSNTKKLWLEQEAHLAEIYIFLYKYFEKNSDKFIEELENEVGETNETDLEGKVEIIGEEKPLIGEIDKAIKEIEDKINDLSVENGMKISCEDKNEILKEIKEELEEEVLGEILTEKVKKKIEEEIEDKEIQKEIKKIEEEVDNIDNEKKIEDKTGFENENF